MRKQGQDEKIWTCYSLVSAEASGECILAWSNSEQHAMDSALRNQGQSSDHTEQLSGRLVA